MDKTRRSKVLERIRRQIDDETAIINREWYKCRTFCSFVRFEIEGPKNPKNYRKFLTGLMAEFLGIIEEKEGQKRATNRFLHAQPQMWNGDKGAIGALNVSGLRIGYCELYLYDGERAGESGLNLCLWKGAIFRYEDGGQAEVVKIYLVANAFEEFLKQKGVKFQRFNTKREKR